MAASDVVTRDRAPGRVPGRAARAARRPAAVAHRLDVECAGETLRVVSDAPAVVSALRSLYLPGARSAAASRSGGAVTEYAVRRAPPGSAGAALLVETGGAVLLHARDERHALRCLVDVIHRFLFRAHGPTLRVHAGAVSRGGVGVMLPGDSGAGKSTLTLALLWRGCAFLSDELAILTPGALELLPSRICLSVRPPAFPLFPELAAALAALSRGAAPCAGAERKAFVRPDVVGRAVGRDLDGAPCPLGLVVFPRFRRGGGVRWEPLPPGEALRRLLPHCRNLQRGPAGLVDVAVAAARDVPCFALTFDDVHAAAARIVAHTQDLARTTTPGRA